MPGGWTQVEMHRNPQAQHLLASFGSKGTGQGSHQTTLLHWFERAGLCSIVPLQISGFKRPPSAHFEHFIHY